MARHLYVGPDGDVLAVVENQEGARVHVAWEPETALEWWLDFEHAVIPEDDGYAISSEGLAIFIGSGRPADTGEMEAIMPDVDDEDAKPIGYRLGPLGQRFIKCCHPITGFREFLRVWHFLDQDTGRIKLLGECLWPGQEHFALVAALNLWVYFLKARQLGETTIAIAYDGWVMRFRQTNARVHLVSRTEDLAKRSLLKPLKAGLKALPEEMLLPEAQTTTTIYELNAGPDDRRAAYAYPAKEPGRGETCSHLHLDEWAAMGETSPELPKDVWAAAEPTISKHGGSCHILTTGTGPVGYYADVWRSCIAETGQLKASFIPAAGSRPEYTEAWLEAKRVALADDAKFRHEYPETWMDALSGAGDTFFTSYQIDKADEYARGALQLGCPREKGKAMYLDKRTGKLRRRRYVKAWDIAGPGDKSDAVVGTVLDVTEAVWDVVEQEVYHGEPYPMTAYRIEVLHTRWPGITVIEDNAAGAAVRSFLKLPEEQVLGFTTSRQSKPIILSEVLHTLQAQTLKWAAAQCKELDVEMRSYKLADESIKQDCVMSLAIAVHHGAETAHDSGGRVGKIVRV